MTSAPRWGRKTEKETAKTDASIDHSKRHPSHIAYAVRDGKEGSKGHWSEIGAAWTTKDGRGFVLHLNALLIDGRVILQPKDKN